MSAREVLDQEFSNDLWLFQRDRVPAGETVSWPPYIAAAMLPPEMR